MLVLGKIALGLTVGAIASAGLLCSDGLIDVNVVQGGQESHHVHVIAPALLVPIAIRLIPAKKVTHASNEIRPLLPSLQAAVSSLRDTDDFTLAEGTRSDEEFRVAKSNGNLVIDVTNVDQTVHVSVPLRALSGTVDALASRGEYQ